jgi:hypothetical protein
VVLVREPAAGAFALRSGETKIVCKTETSSEQEVAGVRGAMPTSPLAPPSETRLVSVQVSCQNGGIGHQVRSEARGPTPYGKAAPCFSAEASAVSGASRACDRRSSVA